MIIIDILAIYAVSVAYVANTKDDEYKERFVKFLDERIKENVQPKKFAAMVAISPILLTLKIGKYARELWSEYGDDVKETSKKLFKKVVAFFKKNK